MLIGDYFDEVSRSIHDHQTAGFIQSSDLFTDARSDDLGYLRATLTFHDGSELHLRRSVPNGTAKPSRSRVPPRGCVRRYSSG